jgi:hypothetical protein
MSSRIYAGLRAGQVVLACVDTLHFSADISVSDAVRAKLDQEKEVAQSVEVANSAHCPDWLGAQVHPHGSRGGYALRSLLDTPTHPSREEDPAAYVVAKARQVEEMGEELSPEDKDLAYQLFVAGFHFTADTDDE